MNEEEKYIGYLKYSGQSIEDGLLDVRKSAEALLGFDQILRYFLVKEDPVLQEIDFEIPVRIRKGSWEALIPEIAEKLISIKAVLATSATIYMATTARKAAEDGFCNTGIAKDIKTTFKNAIKAAQWVIKIATHTGTLAKKTFEKVKFQNYNKEIGIPNDSNEYLWVPKKYFDLFSGCPEKIFGRNASIIEKERTLEFGVYEGEYIETVTITEKEKWIFYSKTEEDILFPELKQGQYVELEGKITRENEKSNTIGFEYQNLILTCRPRKGNITTFKNKIISQEENYLFPKVKIIGIVDRKEKKPQIIFSDIFLLDSKNKNQ